MIEIKHPDWLKEGEKRYGENHINWKFICPMCKKVSSGHEFKELGKTPDDMVQNCIGRFMPDKNQSAFFTKNKKPIGCDFAAYGLFQMSGVKIVFDDQPEKKVSVLDFADDPLAPEK